MQNIDCRLCINCLDKHRYGGPGIRKKSCIKKSKKEIIDQLHILSQVATFLLIQLDDQENNDENNNQENNQENNIDHMW